MNNKYYRISCMGIGIYEYLKNYLISNYTNGKELWLSFINSSEVNWLDKPNIYEDNNHNYCSYFNEEGFQMFKEKTLPLINKWIDNSNINIEKVSLDLSSIIYSDCYQVVLNIPKINKAREFCSKVRELADEYNLSFFVVTEGASATSNNGCEAVKNARDCHIKWEMQYGFDPEEDWSNDSD